MTMLQVHLDAINSGCVTYHEFLLRYRTNAKIVYGIVEGKDDPMFYRGLIEGSLPEGWEVELIPAGNKDNVIKAITAFDWTRFSSKQVCFFVDRDLSDFVPNGSTSKQNNLYVTDNYSIENDAVNFSTLKRLLEEVLNIGSLNSEEASVLKHTFENGLSVFREAMIPIMAQIILWQRSGLRPCLNDIRPKEFFIFADGKISLKKEYETVTSRLNYAASCVSISPSAAAQLLTVEQEFRDGQGVERFIRGKYILWFMVEFALEIHRYISNLIKRFTAAPKVRISLGASNAMVVIAPRVRCPVSLQDFLNSTYVQFISEYINNETKQTHLANATS